MTEAKDKGWAVSVDVGGETVLTIGHNHLSGADNIEVHQEAIINCARHLLSFIGGPEREAALLKALEEVKAELADYFSGEMNEEQKLNCVDQIDRIISAALSSIQKDQK